MRIFIALLLTAFSCMAMPPWVNMTTVPSAASYTYQSETLTYGTAITNNGGTISIGDFLAVDTFVVAAKSHGYWSNIVDCSPFAGDQTNAAFVKLKSMNSGILVTNKGFLATDYDKTKGFTGWGGSKYFNIGVWTDFNVSGGATNGGSVWFSDYVTNASVAEGVFGTTTAAPPYFTMLTLGGNFGGGDVRTYTTYGTISAPTAFYYGIGLMGFTCPSANLQYGYQNGYTNSVGVLTGSTTTKTAAVSVFAEGGSLALQNKPLGWYEIDNGIPVSAILPYFNDVSALMRALGRVPDTTHAQQVFLVGGQSLSVGDKTYIGTLTNRNTMALGEGSPIVQSTLSVWRNQRSKLFESPLTETGWRAFADEYNSLESYSPALNPLIINWGYSGANYAQLAKGSTTTITKNGITTNNYQFSVNDISYQQRLQTNIFGTNLVVSGILWVHGEGDASDPVYGSNMMVLQSNYVADISVITHQTNNIPIFLTQQPSYTNQYANSNMLQLATAFPANFILVGPKYQYLSIQGGHLTNSSYEQMGEEYALSVQQYQAHGYWWPLYAVSADRTTSTITVTMTNNWGNAAWPLVFDTNTVAFTNLSMGTVLTNYGIQYSDNSGSPPTITGVSLVGTYTNQIQITLSGTPTGTKWLTFGYPYAGMINLAMNTNSPRTCIRDSCTNVGAITGSNIWDWACHQLISVP